MLYSTPFVAVAPLLTLWLGIGLAAHVAVVFIVVVFPVLVVFPALVVFPVPGANGASGNS